ncbi:MAG: hypothetical protein ACRELS_16425 [Candidatus Rokuibacteriota bacterium]
MTRLLVLTAVDVEARALARHLGLTRDPTSRWPHFSGGVIEIATVGLRASRLVERAERFRTHDLCVSAGACGALAPELSVGELVVPQVVIGPDSRRWPAAPLRGLAGAGALLSVAEVVESAAQKSRLWLETGACAVDMESAAILAWAGGRGVPAAVVRGVSDDATRGIPAPLAAAVGDDGRVRPLRAVTAALSRASALGDLMALRAGTEAALKAVAGALARVAREASR